MLNPAIHPENFRAPFTAAEGWGTFCQTVAKGGMQAKHLVGWGKLSLKSLRLNPRDLAVKQVEVTLGGTKVDAKLVKDESGVSVEFAAPVSISAGHELAIAIR